MLNKNTQGVKKDEAKKNQRLKVLISTKAKKSVQIKALAGIKLRPRNVGNHY